MSSWSFKAWSEHIFEDLTSPIQKYVLWVQATEETTGARIKRHVIVIPNRIIGNDNIVYFTYVIESPLHEWRNPKKNMTITRDYLSTSDFEHLWTILLVQFGFSIKKTNWCGEDVLHIEHDIYIPLKDELHITFSKLINDIKNAILRIMNIHEDELRVWCNGNGYSMKQLSLNFYVNQ